jgi:hypothetical protein
MVHVTCDCCRKELYPADDQHFVVKIEVFASQEPLKLTEADLDEDHMEEVSKLLCEIEDNPDDDERVEPTCRHFRYDLCPECHKKFVRDPLGREAAQKFDFSKN